jgi:hypothetical protein
MSRKASDCASHDAPLKIVLVLVVVLVVVLVLDFKRPSSTTRTISPMNP